MISLPTELHTLLRNTLIDCHEFQSYRLLRAIIEPTELGSYRIYIQQADNPSDLVDLFLAEFLKHNLTDGRSVLLVFLDLLRNRYPIEDAFFNRLNAIIDQITIVMHPIQPIHRADPHQRGRLHDLLPRLNFRSQVQMVRKVIDQQQIAAFLIHGPPDFGQRVLANRLSHLLPQWSSGRYIVIDAGSNGTGKSSRSLWREIARILEASSEDDPMRLAEMVCQWWRTQDVIIVIHTVDYIPSYILSTWLDDFWVRLVSIAHDGDNKSVNTHLLLYLVDYSGSVSESNISFADNPELIRDAIAPLRLPIINRFPKDEVDIWLDMASDVLPVRPDVRSIMENSQDGTPGLVYEIICSHCGFSWGGEFAP